VNRFVRTCSIVSTSIVSTALILMAWLPAQPAWGQGASEFYRGDVAPAPAAKESPPELRDVGFDQRMGETVPLDLTFRDAEGRQVRLGDFFGERPVVLSLVYFSCPMLCPMTLQGLASSLKALSFDIGEGYEVVVVSFNPEEDPEMAAEAKQRAIHRYGRAGTEKGWHFLTGDAEAIAALTDAVGFRYTYDADRGEYAHGAGLVALTPEGEIARYFFGIEFPPKDLKLGLVEAGEGRIGSAVDQLVLYCFHYDPATGQYYWSAWTYTALKVTGAVTVLALVGFIVLMLRRERQGHLHDPRTASHA
jgi:protein SCO1/2